MSEWLSREASALLEAVRAAEDATDEDEARVLRALTASVAAGVSCHWERYPVRAGADREGAAREDAARGDGAQGGAAQGGAATPPAAWLGHAGGALAKAGLVAWGAPLGALALGAAAWLVVSGGDRAVQPSARSSVSVAAPTAAPDSARAPAPPAEPRAAASEGSAADAGPSPMTSPRVGAAPSRPRRAVRAAAQRPEPSGLAAELALLQRAQAALRRGDGAAALGELEALPESGGQLLGERRVARVLALCSLGRVAEAEALAADVLRSEPASMQRGTLARSCANPSRNRQR